MGVLLRCVYAIALVHSICQLGGVVDGHLLAGERQVDGGVVRHLNVRQPNHLQLEGFEYDNQADDLPIPANNPTNGANNTANQPGGPAKPATPAPAAAVEKATSKGSGDGTTPEDSSEAPEGPEEIIPPLVIYLLLVGIILATIVLLVVVVAMLVVVCSIPSCDKEEEEEEDACAMPKGNSRSSGSGHTRRPSTPLSRFPSFSHGAADARYSEQSADLVHKSRGSSLGRHSSCRICPRFASKSSRARSAYSTTSRSSSTGTATGTSTGTNTCTRTGGGGEYTSASGAGTGGAAAAAGTKDYFVACVCDLAGSDQYSPSISNANTLRRG